MAENDAIAHLDEAIRALTLEAYRGSGPNDMERSEHFTVAEELERIDRAIGPKGESMFAAIADNIKAAYVELLAARAALSKEPPHG